MCVCEYFADYIVDNVPIAGLTKLSAFWFQQDEVGANWQMVTGYPVGTTHHQKRGRRQQIFWKILILVFSFSLALHCMPSVASIEVAKIRL